MIDISELLPAAIVLGIYPPVTPGGGGTVTSVGSGTGLTGGPITATGSLSFAPIAANSLWVNATATTAVPAVMSFTNFATTLGLGTMAYQNANAVNITGGTVQPTTLIADLTPVALSGTVALALTNTFTEFYANATATLSDSNGIAAYTNGFFFILKNTATSGSTTVTFTPKAGDTIDGNTSLVLNANQSVIIAKMGTEWGIVASNSGVLDIVSTINTIPIFTSTNGQIGDSTLSFISNNIQNSTGTLSLQNNLTIGANTSASNPFIATQYVISSNTVYNTGTVTQSGSTVTGSGTTFTQSMVGAVLIINGYAPALITAVASSISLTVSTSATISTATAYSIYDNGVSLTNTGSVGVSNIYAPGNLNLYPNTANSGSLIVNSGMTANYLTLPGVVSAPSNSLYFNSGLNIPFFGSNAIVVETGSVTAGHIATWNSTGIIQDGGVVPVSSPWIAIGTDSAYGGGASTPSGASSSLVWGNTSSIAASSTGAIAMGNACTAGSTSVAIGNSCNATGGASVCIGDNSTINTSTFSVGLGAGCNVAAALTGCVAIGYNAVVTGNYGIAMGYNSKATAAEGIAIGYKAVSTNQGSFVSCDSNGTPAADTAANQFRFTYGGGYYFNNSPTVLLASITTTANSTYVPLAIYASGSAADAIILQSPTLSANNTITLPATDGSANYQLITNGAGVWSFQQPAWRISSTDNIWDYNSNPIASVNSYCLAFGTGATAGSATGITDCIALGRNAVANSNSEAIAIGYTASATGGISVAIGANASTSGGNTTAIGPNTIASANYGTAVGNSAKASAAFGAALGSGAQATGASSVALGNAAVSSGQYSVALGYAANAQGYESVAGPQSITGASAANSVALGFEATTNFAGSFVFVDSSYGGVSTNIATDTAANQFIGSFAGGYQFWISNNTGAAFQAVHITTGGNLNANYALTATGNFSANGPTNYIKGLSGTAQLAGGVGELVQVTATGIGLASGTTQAVLSHVFGTGTWLVTPTYFVTCSSSTLTSVNAAASTTSGSIPTANGYTSKYTFAVNTAQEISGTIAPFSLLVTGASTTLYLNLVANFASGTAAAYVSMTGLRIA